MNKIMTDFICKILLVGWTIASLVKGDRLENLHQLPLTSSHTNGPFSNLHAPYPNEYKNLYKGLPTGGYTSAPPQLHKQYSPSVAHSSNGDRLDAIPIVKQAFEPNNGDGTYTYSYETANGISASEFGTYKAGPTSEEGIQSASGSYSYTGPDNVVYTITYTAGLEGFQPQGAHIPTPPPIPEAIQKVLQYATENAKPQQYNEAKYQSYDGGAGTSSNIASNRYTSAVQTPYSSISNYIPNNPNYSKLASYINSDYKVQDDYSG